MSSAPNEAADGLLSPVRQRRFSVAEYHRLMETGVLTEDEHVELLEGVIVTMSPQLEKHAKSITRLTSIFVRGLGDDYEVRPQLPLTLADSEPEPDLAIVRAADARSFREHPTAALLVIETSNESLGFDRNVKGRVYARAGIPEYWVVNLKESRVEVFRDPDPAAGLYRTTTVVGSEGRLRPQAFPGPELAVESLFE